MFTIGQAAERLGVSRETLRAWERRYGIRPAHRTPSGYRMYDEETITSLLRMRDLIKQGWSVQSAAAEIIRNSQPAAQNPTEWPTDEFVDIARSFDMVGLRELLEQRFTVAPFESVVDDWLMPALNELGIAWEHGHVSVAGEHMVAHGVSRYMAAAFDATSENPDAPVVVVGLPSGVRHELGILAFAVAA